MKEKKIYKLIDMDPANRRRGLSDYYQKMHWSNNFGILLAHFYEAFQYFLVLKEGTFGILTNIPCRSLVVPTTQGSHDS